MKKNYPIILKGYRFRTAANEKGNDREG